jgi:hypothetical protein
LGRARSGLYGALLACALCAGLRLPAFRYDVISDDEAIYHAMGRTLAAGGVMYRDAVDHKPPGLAYSYAILQRLAGGNDARAMALVHLLGLLAAAGTCLALWGIARRALPDGLWSLPPLLYGVISACKLPADGLAVNGELLMNLPVALCALCALEAGRMPSRARRALLDLLAGALGAFAALYKYQAAVVLFALPALWLSSARGTPVLGVDPPPPRAAPRPLALAKSLVARGLPSVLGALVPMAAAAAWFHAHGVLSEAIAWGIGFNRSYLAEGPPLLWALGRFAGQIPGILLPGAVLYACGLWTLAGLLRRAPAALGNVAPGARAFLALWALFSVASVALGLRFFGHYFLQPEVPLSLLAAGPAKRLFAARPRLAAASLAVPALLFLVVAALPELTRPILNPRDPDYLGIGRAVERRTGVQDTIWVWGNVPQLYYAASRSPGVRFSFCNYLTGLSPGTPSEYDDSQDPRSQALTWAWPLVLRDLDRNRPALVLDTAAAGLKSYGKFPIAAFPPLADYLAAHYLPEGSISGVVLYRRRD